MKKIVFFIWFFAISQAYANTKEIILDAPIQSGVYFFNNTKDFYKKIAFGFDISYSVIDHFGKSSIDFGVLAYNFVFLTRF